MKKTITTLFFVLFSAILFSQTLHSPGEILKIMEKSPVMFNVEMLSAPVPCPDRSDNLNYHDVYRVKTDSSMKTYAYSLKPEAQPYFEKAEEYFGKHNMDSACYFYEKVLEADPQYYKVMTYLGQVYDTMNDNEKAIEWYNKAIANNYIDYMAHWFLADIYRMKGDIDKAVDEITIASILNRNNPRIKASQVEIFKLAKIKGNDWCFTPQCIISKENDAVKIAFDEYWIGYAMAKAVWKYEPGYRQSMGVAENVYSSLEDKECLVNLMASLTNAKKNISKYPELKTLKKAIENDYINEYIFYEIVLPEHPNVAYQLSESFIERIKDYILKYRYL